MVVVMNRLLPLKGSEDKKCAGFGSLIEITEVKYKNYLIVPEKNKRFPSPDPLEGRWKKPDLWYQLPLSGLNITDRVPLQIIRESYKRQMVVT